MRLYRHTQILEKEYIHIYRKSINQLQNSSKHQRGENCIREESFNFICNLLQLGRFIIKNIYIYIPQKKNMKIVFLIVFLLLSLSHPPPHTHTPHKIKQKYFLEQAQPNSKIGSYLPLSPRMEHSIFQLLLNNVHQLSI